jgi:hypothetical protein
MEFEASIDMAKHSRIFIKSGSDLFYLMWAQFEVNGDVYMGLTAKGSGGLEQVYDPNLGKVLTKDIVAPQSDESLKISFHATGHYKLAARMGLNEDALDRVTVTGPRLADISEPRMMAEILLPAHLPCTTRTPSAYDISLDISPGPPPPHRCAIFCMSNQRYNEVVQGTTKLVDTSEWECRHAFTDGLQVWVWTIRKSANDRVIPPSYLVYFPGSPKWGQPINGG